MAQYLTDEEKEQRVAYWQERQNDPRPEGDLAGRGFPDPPIYDLVDRLNAMPGICTTQSCSGHPEQTDGSLYLGVQGCLWLRLTEPRFMAFIREAENLIAHSCIETVSILWGREREGHAVEIVFYGLNCGKVELAEASQVIEGFFVDICSSKPYNW